MKYELANSSNKHKAFTQKGKGVKMQKYTKRRRTYIFQLAWVVILLSATIIVFLYSDKLLPNRVNGEIPTAADYEAANSNEHNPIINKPTVESEANLISVIDTDLISDKDTDLISNKNTDEIQNPDTDVDLNNLAAENNITDSENNVKIPESDLEVEPKKLIAFTFDDGPYPDVTNRILDVFEENNAKATFFVMGNRMSTYPNTVIRAYELGCQIGNHTYSHKQLTTLDKAGIIYEVEHSNELINEVVDVGDVILRLPYGSHNELVDKTVKVPMVNWSVDSEDWLSKNKDKIIQQVLDTIHENAIILMHDLYGTTADAVEYLVPYLVENGYELVTVDELFKRNNIELEAGKAYRNAN